MRKDGAAFDRLIITLDQSMNMGDVASEGPGESDRAPATASKKAAHERERQIRTHPPRRKVQNIAAES
jgi:hypothetical protein